jgi:Fe-S cluster biogenesis protein NfuA
MIIETEQTPKPDVMNFFPEKEVLKKGSAEFKSSDDITCSPLAERLFEIDGVKSIFLSENLVSVTKDEDEDWEDLKPIIMASIMEHFAMGEPVIVEEALKTSDNESQEEIIKKINALLDARIRPAVKQDGGDIAYRDFKDGVVYVEMQGSCNGCPYAVITLKDGVEATLKHYIPQVKSVEAVPAK